MLMFLSVLGFTSCDDELAQPPVNLPEGGIGTGAWDNPMTAYQAHLGTVNDDYPTPWVKGYIVGYIDTDISNVLKEETARFSAPATIKTNMLIAVSPDETNWENCVPVQLPSGDVRNALNLGDHPENLGKLVTIQGTTGSKYCSAYGVRSVSAYKWGDLGEEPDPNMTLPVGSRQIVAYNFLNGMEGFTFDQGISDPAGFEVWKLDEKYGIVAKGYGANSTDAMAISPEIDLTGYTTPRLLVHNAANYFNNKETFVEMAKTVVRVVGETEWTEVAMPIPPSGTGWTFTDSGYMNLDAFAGKKIEIAFHFTSDSAVKGTWEIDKVTVYGAPAK